jgi:outer membrane biosynthesis protein TonB
MSDPSSGSTQSPDPDPGKGHDGTQDEPSGSVFNDPTAPVWADPTAPIPAPPTPPGGAPPTGDQPATNPQETPPVAPPVSNPYAQQPPPAYGQQPPPAYGQQPPAAYGQPEPGQQRPGYGQQPYATGPPTETNASAIVLTIVSGVVMLSTCFVIGIPSLIFGIMGLTSNTTDPVGSRKKAKTGWILFAVNAGVVILLSLVGLAILIATGNNFNYDSNDF